jgi:hypothetical protein
LAANVDRTKGSRVPVERWLPVLLAVLVLLFTAAPQVFGVPSGVTKEDPQGGGDFDKLGCTVCHGPGAAGHHDFAAGGTERVTWNMTDAEGHAPAGNVYEAEAVYTITITLNETNGLEAANRAGFNLRAHAGTLEGVDGVSRVSEDGTQATHVSPALTTWQVEWTAPADGVAIFDLFVNDVDGIGGANAGDLVYRVGWWLTDHEHAIPGAQEEHEVHVGVQLQQYWIGLIAIAGMLGIMIFGYIYTKYMSPHHTDQKDR